MTREDMERLNVAEQRKLSKYNNLYDRLRKKRDELQVLYGQRKYLNRVHAQRNNAESLLKSA